ncbi:YdcF family protein [Candidatus Nomurabacteria bacterium]|nr:YdcF family protein [Candidatus Nomurabacteria bacterium]
MIPAGRYFLLLIGVPIAVGLVCVVSVSVILTSSKTYIYSTAVEVPKTDAALILGAGILRNGDLSPVLKDRADKAIELYKTEKVSRIIASGNSSSEEYNETEPIRRYLISNGIPDTAILLDGAGLDTYSSIYRAKSVFTVQSMTIVSQSFHLPRAVFIARELNMEAFGMNADRGKYKLVNYFREMAADVKAMGNLFSRRTPTHLQEEVVPSVGSDGRTRYTIPLW